MAANDDFPRGLILSGVANSANVSLTFPACPGIAWVLTDVKSMLADTAVSGGTGPQVDVITNGITYVVSILTIPNGDPAFSSTSDTWSGKIMSPVNGSIVVTFSNAQPTCALVAQAYPI